jgi:hypothetical protein
MTNDNRDWLTPEQKAEWDRQGKESDAEALTRGWSGNTDRSRIDDYKDDDSYGWSSTTGDPALDRKIDKIVNNGKLSDKEKRDMIDFLSPGGIKRSKQRIEDARTRANFADEQARASEERVAKGITEYDGTYYDKWGRECDSSGNRF